MEVVSQFTIFFLNRVAVIKKSRSKTDEKFRDNRVVDKYLHDARALAAKMLRRYWWLPHARREEMLDEVVEWVSIHLAQMSQSDRKQFFETDERTLMPFLVRNSVVDVIRSATRNRKHRTNLREAAESGAVVGHVSASGLAKLLAEEEGDRLRAAIEVLSLEQRRLILAVYFDGVPVHQAAREVWPRISRPTAYRRHAQAIALLAAALK